MNTVTLLIIVAIVSCGLIVVLIDRGLVTAGSDWNENLLSHTECRTGEDLINARLTFYTAANLDTVAAKIVAEIAPCRQRGVLDELYLVAAEPTGDGSSFVLLYCADSGHRKIMETAVLLKSSGIGTAGSVSMETWQAVDGVIDTVSVRTARSVREGVRRAVSQLDSAAEFSERN